MMIVPESPNGLQGENPVKTPLQTIEPTPALAPIQKVSAIAAFTDQHKFTEQMLQVGSINPDTYARATALSRASGIPAQVLNDNVDELDKIDKSNAYSRLFVDSPKTAQAIMAGGAGTQAIVQNDIGSFAEIERASGVDIDTIGLGEQWLNAAKAGAQSFMQADTAQLADRYNVMLESFDAKPDSELAKIAGLPEGEALTPERRAQMRGDIERLRGEALGESTDYAKANQGLPPEPLLARAKRLEELGQGGMGAMFSAAVDEPGSAARTLASSLVGSAPIIGAAVVGGLPAAALMEFNSEYSAKLVDVLGDAGVDTTDPKAMLKALQDDAFMADARQKQLAKATVTTAIDTLGMGIAGKLLAPASIGGKALSEGAKQGTNLVAQVGVQTLVGGLSEGLGQLAADGKVSMGDVALEMMAGGVGAPINVAVFGKEQLAEGLRKSRKARATTQAQTDMVAGSLTSTTREKDPATFRGVVADQLAGNPLEMVWIPAEALQSLNQSGVDVEQLLANVPGLYEQYTESLARGGSVTFKNADYLTYMAEYNEQLGTHVRHTADGFSTADSIAWTADQEAAIDEIAAQMREATSDKADYHRELVGQLVSAGYSRADAEKNAALQASAINTLATRSGKTVEDVKSRFDLSIANRAPDALKAVTVDDARIAIDRLRSGDVPKPADMFGKSLTEYLTAAGGLDDTGGELAGFDADVGKVGRNRLARKGGQSMDTAALAAFERGYFPGMAREDVTPNMLVDALREEAAGNPRYSAEQENATLRDQEKTLNDLQEYLDRLGVDIQELSTDEVLAILKDPETMQGRELNQFAGPVAVTANQEALAQAKQMLADGVDAERVRKDTGWFIGADGKPRFEIADGDAKLTPTFDAMKNEQFSGEEITNVSYREAGGLWVVRVATAGMKKPSEIMEFVTLDADSLRPLIGDKTVDKLQAGEGEQDVTSDNEADKLISETDGETFQSPSGKWSTLGEVIAHERLFDAYPSLKNMKVVYAPELLDGAHGAMSVNARTGEPIMVIGDGSADEVRKTVLHETQHAIQAIEGFARGGSVKKLRSDHGYLAGIERENADFRMEEWAAKWPEAAALRSEINKLHSRLVDKYGDPFSDEAMESELFKQWDSAVERSLDVEGYDEIPQTSIASLVPLEVYERLAGEVEARTVENRSHLSERAAQMIPPSMSADTKNADAIVSWGGADMYSEAVDSAASSKTGQQALTPDQQRLVGMTEDEYIAAVNPDNKRSDESDIVIVRAGDLDLPRSAKKVAGFKDKAGADVDVHADKDGSLYAVQDGEAVGQIENRDGETLNIVTVEAQGKGIGAGLAAELIRRDPFAQAGSFSPAGEATRRSAFRKVKAELQGQQTAVEDDIADLAAFYAKDDDYQFDNFIERERVFDRFVARGLTDESFKGMQLPTSYGSVMVTPSAKEAGMWQVTQFAQDGTPNSDSGIQTKEQALRDFIEEARPIQQGQQTLNQSPTGQTARELSAELEAQYPGLKLDLLGSGDRITLLRIVLPKEGRGQGTGTAVMQRIAKWADQNGKTIGLTPSGDFGGSKSRLPGFYKRFGFVENKGKNRDFEISEAMFRVPSTTLNQSQPQTDSAAFKKWFGDSKVVDANGKPLVVYHGTGGDITQFNTEGRGKTTGSGSFFSSSPAIAATYATGEAPNLAPVYLSLKTPVVVDAGGVNWARLGRKVKVSLPDIEVSDQSDEDLMAELEGREPQAGATKKIKGKSTTLGNLFSGELVYDDDYASTDDLARWAKEKGYDGIIIKNVMDHGPSGRFATEDKLSDIYVAFSSEKIKSAIGNRGTFDPASANILEQSGEEDARGSITFTTGSNRKFQITLGAKRDMSTLLHEFGHYYLEVLTDLAADKAAPAALVSDVKAIREWVGAKEGEAWTTEQHEQFARGFELYLAEGKAPSPELATAFAHFKRWIINAYKDLRRLNVELTPEIRAVMSRIIATDEQIEAAEEKIAAAPMFESAAKAGMSEAEWASYVAANEAASQVAASEVERDVMREETLKKSRWWNAELKKTKQEVAEEVDLQPEYAARRALRTGIMPDGSTATIKMNSAELRERYGVGVQRKLMAMHTTDGVPIDIAAQMIGGFSSGDEMVKAMLGAIPRQDLINQEANARMEQRHGAKVGGEAADRAMEAVHNERRVEVMQRELTALAKVGNRKNTTSQQMLKEAARRIMLERKVRDVVPYEYQRSEQKAGREAYAALVKGDLKAAYVAKQQQLLNFYLWREAIKARESAAKNVAHARSYMKPSKQKMLGKAGHDYQDQINTALAQYEFSNVSLKELGARTSYGEWYTAQVEKGLDPYVPVFMMRNMAQVNHKDLTVQQLNELTEFLDNVNQLAKLKTELQANKHIRDVKEAKELMAASAYANMKTIPRTEIDKNTRSLPKVMGDWLSKANSSLMKMEQVIEWLDGGDANGAWSTIFYQPLAEAQHQRDDWNRKVTMQVVELTDKWMTARGTKMGEVHHIASIGQPITTNGMLAVALNVGNEGNRTKLMKGYGWNENVVAEILGHMTKEDWQYVADMWEAVESLWPAIAALEKQVNGIVPPKVQGIDVHTPFGVIRGGYWPLVYDPMSQQYADVQKGLGSLAPLGENGTVRATPARGFTQARVDGFSAPIVLDVGVIGNHLNQVIHDLTHRVALADAHKLITGEVREAMNRTIGPDMAAQFVNILDGIASDQATGSAKSVSAFSGVMNALRINQAIAWMGYSVTTILNQQAGYAQALDYFASKGGRKFLYRGMVKFWAKPIENLQMIREMSGEMRNRAINLDASIREAQTQVTRMKDGRLGQDAWKGALNSRDLMAKYAFVPIQVSQSLVDGVVWMGAYEMAGGFLNHEESVNAADRAVRLTQTAGGAKDMATIQQNILAKMFMPVYGYSSLLWNRNVDIARSGAKAVKARDPVQVLVALERFIYLNILPAVMTGMIKGALPDDDDDSETWAGWLSTQALLAVTAGIPLIGQAAQGVFSKFGYGGASTIGQGFDNVITAGSASSAQSISTNAVSAIGAFTGLPSSQINRAVKTGFMLESGEMDDSAGAVMRAVLFGPPNK